MELLGQTIGFWTAFIAGIFILLHVPSCNRHWASRLKPLSTFLSKYHSFTLTMATMFALLHVALALTGMVLNIWI